MVAWAEAGAMSLHFTILMTCPPSPRLERISLCLSVEAFGYIMVAMASSRVSLGSVACVDVADYVAHNRFCIISEMKL